MESLVPDGPVEVPTDEDLVRAGRGGDEVALRMLFDRHVSALRARVRTRMPAVLRRRVGESDVLQEACLTAQRRLAEFEDRGPGSFEKWMTQILDHKLHDEIRRHAGTECRSVKREVGPPASSAAWADPRDPGPSPSSAAAASESRKEIESVLSELSDTNRLILLMVHGQGHALQEVARLLGKSPEAVRKAYGRAVAAYSARLTERGRIPQGPCDGVDPRPR